jgi:hypothetical protein
MNFLVGMIITALIGMTFFAIHLQHKVEALEDELKKEKTPRD